MDPDLKRRLRHLAKLEENWDSYGSPPISTIAIEATKQLLERVYIFPLSDGGLQVEFGNPEVFSFTVTPDGELGELDTP